MENDEPLSIKDFSKVLSEFMRVNFISTTDLKDICNEYLLSRSSCHRLKNGQVTEPYYQKILPILEEKLKAWMISKNWESDKINTELNKLFPNSMERKMIINRTELTSAAIKFFGLLADPFDVDRVPGDDEMFSNSELDDIANRVRDAVLFKRFVAVIGDIGTGKTSLKIRVARELNRAEETVHLIYPEFFDMNAVSVGSIASYILDEFNIKPPQNTTMRVKRIKQLLTSMEKDGHRIALVFDECHRLNDRVLVSLKNFWEMTNGGYDRLLGIVLFGQPSFTRTMLRDIRFSEIAQRVQVLQMPQMAKSARNYLTHKLSVVNGDIEQLFDSESLTRICTVAKTPLALGNLANTALMSAYELEENFVTSAMLKLPDTPALRQIRRAA